MGREQQTLQAMEDYLQMLRNGPYEERPKPTSTADDRRLLVARELLEVTPDFGFVLTDYGKEYVERYGLAKPSRYLPPRSLVELTALFGLAKGSKNVVNKHLKQTGIAYRTGANYRRSLKRADVDQAIPFMRRREVWPEVYETA